MYQNLPILNVSRVNFEAKLFLLGDFHSNENQGEIIIFF